MRNPNPTHRATLDHRFMGDTSGLIRLDHGSRSSLILASQTEARASLLEGQLDHTFDVSRRRLAGA